MKADDVEEYRGYEVSRCRGHFHVAVSGMLLISPDFRTREEAKVWIDEMIAKDEAANL